MRESSRRIGKRALQAIIVIGSLVPIAAGGAGMILGPGFFGDHIVASADLDGHFRYLSGLLLGIGLAYLSAVPKIEKRRQRFLLLAGLVFWAGLAVCYLFCCEEQRRRPWFSRWSWSWR